MLRSDFFYALEAEAPAVTFKWESVPTDDYEGYWAVTAHVAGTSSYVGTASIAIYKGSAVIEWIRVDETQQRQGIGAAIFKEVCRRFSGKRVLWTTTSVAGSALKARVDPAGSYVGKDYYDYIDAQAKKRRNKRW